MSDPGDDLEEAIRRLHSHITHTIYLEKPEKDGPVTWKITASREYFLEGYDMEMREGTAPTHYQAMQAAVAAFWRKPTPWYRRWFGGKK